MMTPDWLIFYVSVTSPTKTKSGFPQKFTEEELKKRLTKDQFAVTQKAGTEKYVGIISSNERRVVVFYYEKFEIFYCG